MKHKISETTATHDQIALINYLKTLLDLRSCYNIVNEVNIYFVN